MGHTITPTLWDESICASCGFPAAQHDVLYGPADVEIGKEGAE